MISTIKVNETQEKRFGTEWIFKSAKSNQRFLICEEKTNKRNPKEKEKNRREAEQKNVVFVSRKHDERYLYHRIVYLIKEMQAEKQKSKKEKDVLAG